MSDESMVDVDSSSLAQGDLDSQDATQQTGDDGTGLESSAAALQGTPAGKGNDPVTAKRIADTQAARGEKQQMLNDLKEAQRQLSATNLEVARMRGEMDASRKPPEPPRDPMANVLTADMLERFDVEPKKVLAEVVANFGRANAELLQMRDEYHKTEIAKLVEERVNPERVELRDTIAQLSKQSWFSGLSPSEQLQAAKDYRQAAGGGHETPPGGGLGGTQRRSSPTNKTAAEIRQERALAVMDAAWPKDEDVSLEPTLSVVEPRR